MSELIPNRTRILFSIHNPAKGNLYRFCTVTEVKQWEKYQICQIAVENCYEIIKINFLVILNYSRVRKVRVRVLRLRVWVLKYGLESDWMMPSDLSSRPTWLLCSILKFALIESECPKKQISSKLRIIQRHNTDCWRSEQQKSRT